MFRLINYFQDIFKSNIKFYLSVFALISIIFVTQFNYWFGDFNRADLNSMKEEITQISKENEELLLENELLQQERDKLSSGRDAIEGAARDELGLIKPGETFYVFKDAKEVSPKDN